MALTNKTKQIIILESCKRICRLHPIVCNNKHKWNKDKSDVSVQSIKNVAINFRILIVVNENIEQHS